MSTSSYSRKLRQLDQRVREWNLAIRSGAPKAQLIALWKKICVLVQALQKGVTHQKIASKLAAIVVSGGFALQADAQFFAPPVENPFSFEVDSTNYVGGLCAADLDGDGDLDLLMGGFFGTIDYLENRGTPTAPVFDTVQTNPFGLTSTYVYAFMTAADLDNDGDLDILAGQYQGNHIYYQNVGTATAPFFTVPLINPFGLSAGSYISMPDFADLDNDGDYDVISGEAGGLIYFENLGTAGVPSFGSAQSNPFGLQPNPVYFSHPSLGDLDGDGDFDMVIGETNGDFRYMQNLANANAPLYDGGELNPFGITGGILPVMLPEFADIDADGDLDMLVSAYEGSLWFYENLGVAGLNELESSVSISPNPFNDYVKIGGVPNPTEILLLDALGREVYREVQPSSTMDLSEIPSGVYTLIVVDENRQRHAVKIISS